MTVHMKKIYYSAHEQNKCFEIKLIFVIVYGWE